MDSRTKIVAIVIVAILVVSGIVTAVIVNNNNQTPTYTVSYDANYDGAPEAQKISYLKGDVIELLDNTAIRQNYVFSGWYNDKECTDMVAFPYTVTGNKTFYAKWMDFNASDFLDTAFFTETEYGEYIQKSLKLTNGFGVIKNGSADITKQLASCGMEHAVIYGDGEYIVYDMASFASSTPAFSFSDTLGGGVIHINSINLYECENEFIIVETIAGYYVYDLTGVQFGPYPTIPEIVVSNYVVMGDKCYGFDPSDSKLMYLFDITDDCIPEGEGDTTYFEMDYNYDIYGDIESICIYILDDEYNIVITEYIPAEAHNTICFHLTDDCYFIQYALATDDDDFTYIEDGQRYLMYTEVIDGISGVIKGIEFDYPAFAYTDMTDKYTFSSIFAEDITNLISLYRIDSNKELDKSGKMLVCLDENGDVAKNVEFSMALYNFSFIFPIDDKTYYVWFYNDGEEDVLSLVQHIVDNKLNVLISDVVVNNCMKYFIRNAADDTKIYDITGKSINNYDGKTYAGCTNNILFFTDSNGALYKFVDNSMTKCDDYASDLITGNSFYGYKIDANTYRFFTENGSVITETSCNNVREYSMFDGSYLIEIDLGSGSFKLVKTTSST